MSKRKQARNLASRIPRAIGGAKPKWRRGTGSWLPSECFIVATGRVQWFKSGVYTLVKTKSAEIRVYWAGDLLPPNVFIGKVVHFFGRFKTYNEGRIFMVTEALAFQGAYRDIAKPILKLLYSVADDPRDWAEKESLDKLLIQDVDP